MYVNKTTLNITHHMHKKFLGIPEEDMMCTWSYTIEKDRMLELICRHGLHQI